MTAIIDPTPAATAANSASEGVPGLPLEQGTTTQAGHPSEAFLMACVLAEHGNPLHLPDSSARYVDNILTRHRTPADQPVAVLEWRTRLPGSGEADWRYRWTRACKAVRRYLAHLPGASELPAYENARFDLEEPPPGRAAT